jgi:2C-methyl-D-erythritol 2,4-cyclodiphosphate synthase
MAERSDQAVAPAQPPPDTGPEAGSGRRLLVGWTTALAALGVSTALVALGIWLVRLPLAEFLLGATLSQRGVDADFDVVELEWERISIANFVVGAEAAPDAAIAAVDAHWIWEGLSPRLVAVRAIEPRVRFSLDTQGRLGVDALDNLRREGRARRASIPAIELDIVDGQALIQSPFGAVTARYASRGTLGEDFRGDASVERVTLTNGAYALTDAEATLVATSSDETIRFDLAASAGAIVWDALRLEASSLSGAGATRLDFASVEVALEWQAGRITAPDIEASSARGTIEARGAVSADGLGFETWEALAQGSAGGIDAAGLSFADAMMSARASGEAGGGALEWDASGERFAGLAMLARRASASGAGTFALGQRTTFTGDAQVELSSARLDDRAQRDLRAAIPDLTGAPIGPTLAAAEAALIRAGNDFDANGAFTLAFDGEALRVVLMQPALVSARSGAVLRVSPLRQDTPTLTLIAPGGAVGGAAALDLSGGGAPNATLLLDRVAHSPEAAFSADGTLALSDWRADGASIEARELDVSLGISADGGGRLDIAGPVAVTGPLGDGGVRDLTAALDVTARWGEGWRLVSNGCIPVRMGQLDAAGLSFTNGDLALCAIEDALIAANARGALSGGFSVQRVALNGRMGGADGQRAQLSASNIVGRFSGLSGDIVLAISATAPRLTIDMAEDRTLELALNRATANASITDTWRVDGVFSEGSLSDPALPGTISAIAGEWSAAPENNGAAVIRVAAGEALLTANRPATDDERPLFNPLRLAGVTALVRDGVIIAEGALVLDESDAELARFSARHLISDGDGSAQVVADRIRFTRDGLQPYNITEQARGMVENVNGDASAVADIVWAGEAIAATGRVRLEGLSLSTSTIPIVDNVNGEIFFDDLFALTTPPGQLVTVGELNPGVAVRNGTVRFRLLPEQQVAIEDASFDFASGRLAMAPTTITLGSEETRFELVLRDVDASELIATLGIPDLAATGAVEGSFPLLLTRRTAFIENGVLRAQPGGGIIAYTGSAGDGATGPVRLAFDALRRFNYDALELTLNGDLNGEVVSSISFSGQNASEDVQLGDIAPLPGVGDVTVRGVPFDFNVTISAPFRALAQTATSITDPMSMLNQQENGGDEGGQDEGIDAPGDNSR